MGDDKPAHPILAKLKSVKEVVGAIIVVGGAIVAVVSYGFEQAMEDRDEKVDAMTETIASMQTQHADDSHRLNELLDKLEVTQSQTLDSARARFRQNEVTDTELRGSVSALRTEVRIRHREDPEGYGVTRGTPRLRVAGSETDRMLTRAQNAQPQSIPLEGL